MFIASGYQKFITHTFVGDDSYIAPDTLFGMKETLVASFDT